MDPQRDASERTSFDRAVEYYDRTRGLTPAAMDAVTSLLGRELAGRGRCLEVGVGTGRIALPLHAAGVEIAGIDVSAAMMLRLVDKAGGNLPFPLAVADAAALPFRRDAFGGALAVHVLHLIPQWRVVLDEVVRAVRSGGVFVTSHTDDDETEDVWREIAGRFREAAGLPRHFPGADRITDIDAALERHGARRRDLGDVVERTSHPPEELIARMEEGLYSFTWSLDDTARRRAAEEVRAWAEQSYGPLQAPVEAGHTIHWRAYDLGV